MNDGLSILALTAGNSALITFALYLTVVFVLAGLANRQQKGKSFMNEYFLGNRNLGMWAFAFTYAATSASGGSFMGFPALIYTHGWSLTFWIGGYVVVPLVAIGLIAKRLNQVARKAGAITVPEILSRRLGSRMVGNVGTVLLVVFQFIFLLAQFKAGAEIMTTLLGDVPAFQIARDGVGDLTNGMPLLGPVPDDYLLCLLVFAVSVIAYTAWGGFRAVVWTDVMQGIIMGLGVMIMLGLMLVQVGGLSRATREIAQQVPPKHGMAILIAAEAPAEKVDLPKGVWVHLPGEANATHQLFLRLKERAVIPQGKTMARLGEFEFNKKDQIANHIPVLQLRTLKAIAPGEATLEITAIKRQLTEQKERGMPAITAKIVTMKGYKYGADQPGVYVRTPGPSKDSTQGFIPLILGMCFFAFWPFAGSGQPSYMARQMAFNNTVTLRRSIIFVMVYFSLIYFPLILIFTSGRVMLPGWEIAPDRIMPEMATHLTATAGMPWLAGLLVAAPFAAVMSSVDSFLLLVSGSVVRDIYQRNINPRASERSIKRVSYATTIIVGTLAVLAMLNPPRFLQDLIVLGSGGLAASFLMPVLFTLFWPRLTARACVAGMLSGACTLTALYIAGWIVHGKFKEYHLLGLHPFIWSVVVSTLVIVLVARRTQPPDEKLVENYFGKEA